MQELFEFKAAPQEWANWCLNRYINCFTLDWNELAFAVPETVIDLIVGRCFCYHEIDPLVSPFLCACTINADPVKF